MKNAIASSSPSTRRESVPKLIPSKQSIRLGRESFSNLVPKRKNGQLSFPGGRRKESMTQINDDKQITLDNRIEELKSILNLKRRDLVKCWNIFRTHDLNNQGHCTLDDFLKDMVDNEPRTVFVETVFELSAADDLNHIEFGSLFYTIATFCMFELEEMVRVLFFIFDPEKNGDINKYDMTNFLKILHDESILKQNLKAALKLFLVKRDGTTEFIPVVDWCKRFPLVMEPAFRLQAKIRTRFLGISFWERKLLAFKRRRKNLVKNLERERKMEQRRVQRRIRSELGIQYYLNPRKRERIEKLYPIPVFYIDDDEIKVKFDDAIDDT